MDTLARHDIDLGLHDLKHGYVKQGQILTLTNVRYLLGGFYLLHLVQGLGWIFW